VDKTIAGRARAEIRPKIGLFPVEETRSNRKAKMVDWITTTRRFIPKDEPFCLADE
jgi:hypothetical protein